MLRSVVRVVVDELVGWEIPWLNDITSIHSSCSVSNDSPEIPSTFRNILFAPPFVVVLVDCGLTKPLLGSFSSVGGSGGDGIGVGLGGAGGGAGEGTASGFIGGCVGVTGVSLGVAGSAGLVGVGEGNSVQATNKIAVLRNMDRSSAVILFRVIKCRVDMTNLPILFITGSSNYMYIVQTVNSYLVRCDVNLFSTPPDC